MWNFLISISKISKQIFKFFSSKFSKFHFFLKIFNIFKKKDDLQKSHLDFEEIFEKSPKKIVGEFTYVINVCNRVFNNVQYSCCNPCSNTIEKRILFPLSVLSFKGFSHLMLQLPFFCHFKRENSLASNFFVRKAIWI